MILRSKESIVLNHLIKGNILRLPLFIDEQWTVYVCRIHEDTFEISCQNEGYITLSDFTLKEFLQSCNKLNDEEINKILLHKISFN